MYRLLDSLACSLSFFQFGFFLIIFFFLFIFLCCCFCFLYHVERGVEDRDEAPSLETVESPGKADAFSNEDFHW